MDQVSGTFRNKMERVPGGKREQNGTHPFRDVPCSRAEGSTNGQVPETDGGADGYVIVLDEVRGTYGRVRRPVRCRPGDLLWRYRKGLVDEAGYQAAIRYLTLWELSSAGGAKSADWSRAPGSGSVHYGGLTVKACDALTDLRNAQAALGKLVAARLYDHVVLNLTVAEVALKHDDQRKMAAILESDLRAAVDHFGFIRAA
jgi:hypothetical protein